MLETIGLNFFAIEKSVIFSPQECKDIIKNAERLGFTETQVNKFGKEFNDPNIRSDKNVSISDPYLANTILSRITPFLPTNQTFTINTNLRYSKYEKGNVCNPHCDTPFVESNGTDDIQCTVMLYLNTPTNGGATRLFNVETMQHIDILPETGKILIFDQRTPHAGLPSGDLKYTVRTDIYPYTPPPPITSAHRRRNGDNTTRGRMMVFD